MTFFKRFPRRQKWSLLSFDLLQPLWHSKYSKFQIVRRCCFITMLIEMLFFLRHRLLLKILQLNLISFLCNEIYLKSQTVLLKKSFHQKNSTFYFIHLIFHRNNFWEIEKLILCFFLVTKKLYITSQSPFLFLS